MNIRRAFAALVENPCNVSFETQTEDEKTLLLLRRHFVTNIPWIAFSLLMFFVPFLVAYLPQLGELPLYTAVPANIRALAVLVWYLLAIGFAFEGFLLWYFNVFIVTDKRIVDVDFWGLLHKSVSETPLLNIQDITHEVGGFWPVIFNYGQIFVQTAGEIPRLEMTAVPHPDRVHKKIAQLLQKADLKGGLGR
jgi:membrane protein YdbS with pleckstrin-like domain